MTYMGGGFGRRGNYELDFVGEAVELSKEDERAGKGRLVARRRHAARLLPFPRVCRHYWRFDSDGWPVAWQVRTRARHFLPACAWAVSNTAVAGMRDLHYKVPEFS